MPPSLSPRAKYRTLIRRLGGPYRLV